MTIGEQRIFDFRPGFSDADPSRVERAGRKGGQPGGDESRGLSRSPGFTIAAACSAWAQAHGAWPEGLRTEVRLAMARLEAATERTFGRGPRPLFVAVRSGAAASMPGMMDTILNAACIRFAGLFSESAAILA